MTAKQLEAIRRHGENLLAIFPNAKERDPVKLCKRLRRLELKAHDLATRLCNEDLGEAGEAVMITIEANIETLLGSGEGTRTPRVFINRDPRGYALKISGEYLKSHGLSLHQDWGGYGIIAPEIGPDGD